MNASTLNCVGIALPPGAFMANARDDACAVEQREINNLADRLSAIQALEAGGAVAELVDARIHAVQQ